jgi:hypothetical protein
MRAVRRWFLLWAVLLSASVAPGRAELPEVRWSAPIEVAAGGGFRGPWRMNASDYDYVDDPTVAINAQGVVAVAWADQARKDLFVQLYAPDGTPQLAQPVNVSRSPHIFSWLPRMLLTSTEPLEVYLLWQEIVFSGGSHGGEIFFARSHDGGQTWSAPRNLSNDRAGSGKGRLTPDVWHNGSLDLARGPAGQLYAAWTDYEGHLWFSRSTDRGDNFSRPWRVAGDAPPTRGPALAVDVQGDIYLAWAMGDDRARRIQCAASTDQGRSFGAPRRVDAGTGHPDAPKLAVDRQGTVHLVYAESPAGPFERYGIQYTRSHDRGESFAAPREIARPHAAQFASMHFPALSVDGQDGLYILWERFPRRGSAAQGLGFTVSSAAGRTFAPPSVVPGSLDPALGVNGSQQGLLMRKLAVNQAGAIAVVNSTFKSHAQSRIWLWRGQRQKALAPLAR